MVNSCFHIPGWNILITCILHAKSQSDSSVCSCQIIYTLKKIVKPYFKVDRNTFKGIHLIPEWNVTFFHFGLAYQ